MAILVLGFFVLIFRLGMMRNTGMDCVFKQVGCVEHRETQHSNSRE